MIIREFPFAGAINARMAVARPDIFTVAGYEYNWHF